MQIDRLGFPQQHGIEIGVTNKLLDTEMFVTAAEPDCVNLVSVALYTVFRGAPHGRRQALGQTCEEATPGGLADMIGDFTWQIMAEIRKASPFLKSKSASRNAKLFLTTFGSLPALNSGLCLSKIALSVATCTSNASP